MKKFIKENWFKIIIILSIFFVVAVYLFIIKPSYDKKELIQNNINCQKEGYKIYEKDKKEFDEEQKRYSFCKTSGDIDCMDWTDFYEPEFIFSKELNTCLYKKETYVIGRQSSSGFFSIHHSTIRDVYSNKIFKKQLIIKEGEGEEIISGDKDYKLYENIYFPKNR